MMIIVLFLVVILVFGILVGAFIAVQRLATQKFERLFPFKVGPSLHDSALNWTKAQKDDEQVPPSDTRASGTDAHRP